MPTENRGDASFSRTSADDVLAAWSAAPLALRLTSLSAALAALASTASDVVPLASGLAIAFLVPAALVDWHQRRLPDAIVLVATALFALSLLATVANGSAPSIAGIGLGAAVLAGPLLIMHIVSPAVMGFGDVKAAVVLGMAVGAVAWALVPWALIAAAGSTAAVGALRRQVTVPFGPGLVAGSLVVVLTSALLGLDRIGI